MGDIALPLDYLHDIKDPLLEEVTKYKQEVLEGLQIEEEGLTDLVRKKTKQHSSIITTNSRNYNDPVETGTIEGSVKNGQILKSNLPNDDNNNNYHYKKTNETNDKKVGVRHQLAERLNRLQSNSREINGDDKVKIRHQRHIRRNNRRISKSIERRIKFNEG